MLESLDLVNNLREIQALRAIYEHVPLPFVLKRVCRALRDAGPKRTVTTMAAVTESYDTLRLAMKMGCPFACNCMARQCVK